MQAELFDPREISVATAEMLADTGLRSAIAFLRSPAAGALRSTGDGWPYVERIAECDGRPAWLIDDGGVRVVVISGLVWSLKDLKIAARHVRDAAREAVERLDSAAC